MTEIRVPGLGESVSEATVATWFVKPGEMVAADAMLCELETDKVTVEVRAPSAGVLSEIVAKEGETVAVNALLASALAYDPNVRCDHHDHAHGEGGHTCGEHGCGHHSCH